MCSDASFSAHVKDTTALHRQTEGFADFRGQQLGWKGSPVMIRTADPLWLTFRRCDRTSWSSGASPDSGTNTSLESSKMDKARRSLSVMPLTHCWGEGAYLQIPCSRREHLAKQPANHMNLERVAHPGAALDLH